MGVEVLGGADILPALKDQGVTAAVNTVGGIGNYPVRWRVFERLLKLDFELPNLIHPTAFVEKSVSLETGIQILAKTYISSESRIGFGSLINAGAILSHECILGRCVNLSPGALLAGNVNIKDFAQIGMGATINLRVCIGKEARIGNSAVVKADVPDQGRVYAGTIWPYARPDFKPDDKTFRKIA
jgi:sugar O-acyltransferase (sialic acid O-acetyltransferase NeuD family)